MHRDGGRIAQLACGSVLWGAARVQLLHGRAEQVAISLADPAVILTCASSTRFGISGV